MAKKQKKGSWLVTIKAEVVKELVCDNCTREQAEGNPYDYCTDEQELYGEDYEVTDVKPND